MVIVIGRPKMPSSCLKAIFADFAHPALDTSYDDVPQMRPFLMRFRVEDCHHCMLYGQQRSHSFRLLCRVLFLGRAQQGRRLVLRVVATSPSNGDVFKIS